MDSRYAAGEIVTTVVRSNPLDVVAQQAVAMAALDEWRVEDLAALLRHAHSGSGPGPALAGGRARHAERPLPSDEFGELPPRIVWDRVNGTVRGRSGA